MPLGTADPEPRLHRSSIDLADFYPELRHKRLFLFVGRLHPMKACRQSDPCVCGVRAPSRREAHLVMAGPDSIGWRSELEALAESLAIRDRITFTGPAYGDLKWALYREAEVFILPSHCEAFPYAILEALASSLPVITSNKVNLYHDLLSSDCAIVGDDTTEATSEGIERWLALSDSDRKAMSVRARTCFLDRYSSRDAGRKLVDLVKRDLSMEVTLQ